MSERGAWRLLLALAALNVLGYVDRQLRGGARAGADGRAGAHRGPTSASSSARRSSLVFGVGTLLSWAPRPTAGRGRGSSRAASRAWSAATALTGTASGFAALALWRALVGVGEATLPPDRRLDAGRPRAAPSRLGFATSVYYAGVPSASAAASPLAGWVVPRFGWRACFFLLGALGPRRGRRSCGAWRTRRGAARPRRGRRGRRRGGTVAAGCAARSPPSPRSRSSSRARRSSCTERVLAAPRHLAGAGARLRLLARGVPRGGDGPRRRGSPAASRSASLTDARASAGGRAGGSSPSPPRGASASPRPPPSTCCRRRRPSSSPPGSSPRRGRSAGSAPMVAAIHEMAPRGLAGDGDRLRPDGVNLVGVASGAVDHRRDRRPREPDRRPPVERRPRALGAALPRPRRPRRLKRGQVLSQRGQVLNRAHARRARFKT